MTGFRLTLDVYHGPMELLLYLVRQQELDIEGLAVAPIAEQYLQYVVLLEQIDVNAAGDFLDIASTLIELKSRTVLPGEEEVEAEPEDPRGQLVQRLLEYKQYRDAASMLEERARQWSERFPRAGCDLPSRPRSADRQPIQQFELWDLVSAFGRVLKGKQAVRGPESIRYDETPIHVYMQRINERVRRDGRVAFTAFFESGVHKSALVGMFLAVLELVRHHHVQAAQEELFGEIWIEPGSEPLPCELDAISDYDHGQVATRDVRSATSADRSM